MPRRLIPAAAILLLALTARAEPAPAPRPFDWSAHKGLGMVATENVADLPERCAESRNVLPAALYPNLFHTKNVDRAQFTDDVAYAVDVVLHGSLREYPYPEITYFAHVANYYARRTEMQQAIEKRIGELPAESQKRAWANYAIALVYLGEFKKVIDTFAARKPADPEIDFALAQSYFRLGRYTEALPVARRAYFELEGATLDTRWQVMNIELGLHGKELAKHYSKDIYTMEHVRTIFPTDDWSALPFEDVTDRMGIARWGGTGSVSFADLDGDGWDDLLWERKFFPPKIYRNVGGTRFEAVPDERLGADTCTPIIWTPGDFDNDGRTDLYRHCCNYDGPGPVYLLRNEGDLTFRDVTRGAGLGASAAGLLTGSGMAVSWGDYDLDGNLDLLIGDQFGPTRLHRGNGKGQFTETTKEAGIETPPYPNADPFGSVGVAFGDYNGDLWPDIWIQGWGWNRLYRNNGDGTFANAGESAGIDPGTFKKGYMSFFFDYDSDGLLDIFRGSYVVSSDTKWGFSPICTCSNLLAKDGYKEHEWSAACGIFRNEGNGRFTEMTAKNRFVPLGTMGSNAGDWDNDGYQDVVLGAGGPYIQQLEPFLFYRNNGGDGTFTNITPFTMLSLWGKGHGAAFADFDRDGCLDLALNNGGAAPGDIFPSLLLRNTCKNGNHWIQIHLKSGVEGTNRLALNAKVQVFAGKLKQLQSLESGGRFAASNSFALHFGLGANEKIDKIVVQWPNRKRNETVLTDVPVDQAIVIDEKENTWTTLWKPAPKKPAAVAAKEDASVKNE